MTRSDTTDSDDTTEQEGKEDGEDIAWQIDGTDVEWIAAWLD